MKNLAIGIVLLEVMFKATGLFSTVECPPQLETELILRGTPPSQIQCTMQLVCTNTYQNINSPPCSQLQIHDDTMSYGCIPASETSCEIKFEVMLLKHFDTQQQDPSPCPSDPRPEDPALLSHPDNCSLFYKCDWGTAVMFECPEELHFNPDLQVCKYVFYKCDWGTAVMFECPEELHFNSDLQVCIWPWQAGCDSSWTRCPRSQPHCPAHHTHPVYLPHPHLCDHFYQCDWGTAHLQKCPAGLHFNPRLKVCDWPHNAKCQVC